MGNIIKKEVDLSNLKKKGNRIIWGDSIGLSIYYYLDCKKYEFEIIDYNKDKQLVKLSYNKKKYDIVTSNVLNCNFGNILGTCVRDFRYKTGENVQTIKKKCVILDKFRNHNGEKAYKCECCDCGNVRITPEDYLINKGFVCNSCSDKISYPERFMSSLLNQLGIEYEYQKMFDWSKKVKFKCDNKKANKLYDFYIPLLNTIIEVNGELHYKEGRWSKSRPLAYVKENDKEKMLLARENGVAKYIVIDCFESNLEYIKDKIIQSELNNIMDLSILDWKKCSIDASTSLMKVCSDLWNEGFRSAQKISDKIGISKATVITYLKKFSELGLNDYDPKKELKSRLGKTPSNAKGIIIFKNNIVLGTYKSATELDRESNKDFGVKLNQSEISSVARGEKYLYKGYHFKYIQDLADDEKIKYKIN